MHNNLLFTAPLNAALQHALAHLNGIRECPVDATASLEDLRQRIEIPLTDSGIAAERVIDELVKPCDGGIIGSAGARFLRIRDRRLAARRDVPA